MVATQAPPDPHAAGRSADAAAMPRPLMPRDEVVELDRATGLPRLPASMARATNDLYDHDDTLILQAGGRDWTLRWAWPGMASPAARLADRPAHRIAIGPHRGWLALDESALADLLAEPRAHRLPADLRGALLADALQPAARALEHDLHLKVAWLPHEDGLAPIDAFAWERALRFELSLGTQRHGGHVLLDEDAGAAILAMAQPRPAGVPGAAMPRLMRLRLPLPFTLGRTSIRLHEVGGVTAGDIVRIDHWQSAGTAIRVVADLGGHAGGRLHALAEGSRISLTHWKDPAMTPESTDSDAAGRETEGSGVPLDRLDAMEVSLRFELGGLSIALGDLRNLRPGHVFELPQPLNRSAVRIMAHGNLLGAGYLVAVGDQLGVRVSEFAPGTL